MSRIQLSSRRALMTLAVAALLGPAFATARAPSVEALLCAPGEILSRSEVTLGSPQPGGHETPHLAIEEGIAAILGTAPLTSIDVVDQDVQAVAFALKFGSVDARATAVLHGDSWVLSEFSACVPSGNGGATGSTG